MGDGPVIPILRTREPRLREVLQRLWRGSRGADGQPRAAHLHAAAPRREDSCLPERAPRERKLVKVLFADVVRSMEIAERVDPEEWHRLLDRLFQILAAGVHRYEGTINQYTGDGIMALFGAPIAHEDDRPAGLRGRLLQRGTRRFHPAYEAVRAAARPEDVVLDFYETVYSEAARLAGWDRAALDRPAAEWP